MKKFYDNRIQCLRSGKSKQIPLSTDSFLHLAVTVRDYEKLAECERVAFNIPLMFIRIKKFASRTKSATSHNLCCLLKLFSLLSIQIISKFFNYLDCIVFHIPEVV